MFRETDAGKTTVIHLPHSRLQLQVADCFFLRVKRSWTISLARRMGYFGLL